ncbi:MAG: hypothetical protein ABR589_12605 [Chthoniobacterales bacterium]
MKWCAVLGAIMLLTTDAMAAREAPPADRYRQLAEATPLPLALDPDFQFRKTKTFFIGDAPGPRRGEMFTRGPVRTPAIGAEVAYRLFGAVTELDKRQRFGHYFDFFWRAKRPATVTVRLEYRQQNLRAFTQAREVVYPSAKGSHKTSFAVIGDDYFADGRILAWRCLLIENGKIVAEDKSYLWR